MRVRGGELVEIVAESLKEEPEDRFWFTDHNGITYMSVPSELFSKEFNAREKHTGYVHICPDIPDELTPEQRSAEENLVRMMEEAHQVRNNPPREKLPTTDSKIDAQEAWIKQRTKELERQSTKNEGAAVKESPDGHLDPNPTTVNADDLVQVNSQAFASLLLRQKELQTAIQSGKTLSDEEQKELVMLQFLLGSSNEESLIETQKLSLEEAKDVRAIGEFTFGEIKSLLTGQGLSRGDVIRFLGDVQSGKLRPEEAVHFLEDCKEWGGIKKHTNLSKAEFFAKRLAAREAAQKRDPSNN
jgi:hypothetical protein